MDTRIRIPLMHLEKKSLGPQSDKGNLTPEQPVLQGYTAMATTTTNQSNSAKLSHPKSSAIKGHKSDRNGATQYIMTPRFSSQRGA